MLLYGRLFEPALHCLDVGRDVQRLDVGVLAELVMLGDARTVRLNRLTDAAVRVFRLRMVAATNSKTAAEIFGSLAAGVTTDGRADADLHQPQTQHKTP